MGGLLLLLLLLLRSVLPAPALVHAYSQLMPAALLRVRCKHMQPLATMPQDLTSASCARDTSTSVFAAGCTTSSSFMMVAPSLEIVTLPCRQIAQVMSGCLCRRVRAIGWHTASRWVQQVRGRRADPKVEG